MKQTLTLIHDRVTNDEALRFADSGVIVLEHIVWAVRMVFRLSPVAHDRFETARSLPSFGSPSEDRKEENLAYGVDIQEILLCLVASQCPM